MRSLLKIVAGSLAWVFAAPAAYVVKWAGPLDGNCGLFQFGSQLVSIIPGLLGSYIRRSYYRIVLSQPLEGLVVEFGTIFAQRGSEIGSNVYIGAFCIVGLSRIGDDVLIGSNVNLISGKRVHYFDKPDMPIRLQGGELKKISIGSNSWIGNKAVVMADIGEGCVVGAGSVVTTACEPESIYGGNPARLIRGRIRDE